MSLWQIVALVWGSPLAGLAVLALVEQHRAPRTRPGWCIACASVVGDRAAHLATAHPRDTVVCQLCGRVVPVPVLDTHDRLWHLPRPRGAEDLSEWGTR